MKHFILVICLIIAGVGANAQKLEFKINGLKDTSVFLAKYVGPKLYYADTTMSKGGVVKFDGSKHPRGMYAVITPGTRYFEFIVDKEDVSIEIDSINNMVGTMKVKKSENNKVFHDYVLFMTEQKRRSTELTKEWQDATDERKKEIEEEQKKITKGIKTKQLEIWENNKDKYVGTIVYMGTDPDIPDAPRDEEGNILDSNYQYNYFISHYWDNIDFKDPSLTRSPVFHNKLDRFFSKNVLLQIPDTITKWASWMIDQMDVGDEDNRVFQYTVHYITQKYESSNIMGMDRVFVYMADNYYCGENNKAWWMEEENSKKLCERANKIRNTMIGEKAPMLILTDSTEKKWINLYAVDAEYTILYFWDPNCGHCKKTTPKLGELYDKKFKERGVEIYSVGKATGEDFDDWKEFIVEHDLNFINVGLTKNVYDIALDDPRPLLQHTTIQSLNYTDTYDIYSTPRIFILDKDKVIRYKQLSICQLEEIIDKLTGHKDDPKIYSCDDPENTGIPDAEH